MLGCVASDKITLGFIMHEGEIPLFFFNISLNEKWPTK